MLNKKKNEKYAYVALSVDILHEGHINILKTASKYGRVIVGLLTDEAIATYKKNIPIMSFEKRKLIISDIKYVYKVVKQETLDYTKNLKLFRPDYVVHGDDWKKNAQKKTRTEVIKTLKKWSGKLIEPKYTKNISSDLLKHKISEIVSMPENRVSKLNRLIKSKNIVRILESHNSLTGLIIEKINIKKKHTIEFDGMWSSSLTDSATKGMPDNSSLSFSSRISSLRDMMDVTTKPLIFDADDGGRIEHIAFLTRSLEMSGVSAIIMEDKIGLKKNSLFKNQSGVKQDNPFNFSKKIHKICKTRKSKDFLVIARIESFILGKGLKDALKRAEIYSKAGADAILIHSKEKTPSEIFSFAKQFKKNKYYIPLVSVPSTYSKVLEKDLIKNGFKIVIYANQLLRSAYPAMKNTAISILKNGRAYEADKKIISIQDIINLIKND